MRKSKMDLSVNLIPVSPSTWPRRFLGIVGVSFLLGATISVWALGYSLGTDPLSIVKGDVLDKMVTSKTPSERLIAQGSVIEIAKKVQSSVVGIQAQSSKDDIHSRGTSERSSESVGSGVIIKSDGFILTNAHVIKGANSIIVTLNDEKVPAELIGSDTNSDIAVIRIRKDNLEVARLGAAKNLQVGELAVAIGSPFGFQHSVTAGVISALDRNVTVGNEADSPKTYTNLIQTDAAINPGNSGGALINQKGEVVGINTLIYSTNGISQGIGFAIPVEEASKVATELINDGQVQYPFIGVEGQTVDQTIARKHNLEVSQGALVIEVRPQSPAERAGLKVGDVITKFDDIKIASMDDLVASVRNVGIGAVAKILVNRDGKSQLLTIKTAKRPASF